MGWCYHLFAANTRSRQKLFCNTILGAALPRSNEVGYNLEEEEEREGVGEVLLKKKETTECSKQKWPDNPRSGEK